ncbi:hypothetical protein RQN30_07865 [Arcanobacterium hippocoleae]
MLIGTVPENASAEDFAQELLAGNLVSFVSTDNSINLPGANKRFNFSEIGTFSWKPEIAGNGNSNSNSSAGAMPQYKSVSQSKGCWRASSRL